MASKSEETRQRRESAMAYYHSKLAFYRDQKKNQGILYRTSEALKIFFTGLTPLLIIFSEEKLLQAIVAVLAAVITAVSSISIWKKNYIRFSETVEIIEAAYAIFETTYHETDDAENKALVSFVKKITDIVIKETGNWAGEMAKTEIPAQPHKTTLD